MDFEILKDLLMFLLPGGAIGSVVTWFATRKERKVDVLSKLQESIDLLTKKYTEALDENVQLKADNAKLLANQKTLELKIDHLTEKVSQLTQQLNRQENENHIRGLTALLVVSALLPVACGTQKRRQRTDRRTPVFRRFFRSKRNRSRRQ